jgi:lysophospholipase L1-like esterase
MCQSVCSEFSALKFAQQLLPVPLWQFGNLGNQVTKRNLPIMTNFRTAKYLPDGTAIDDPNKVVELAAPQLRGYQAARNPIILYEGDSLVSRSESGLGTGGFPAVVTSIADGLPTASVTFGYQNVGFAMWERLLSGGVYRYINRGVSGNTIVQVKARLLATDLLPYDCVSLLVGINNLTAAATVANITTAFADILAMVEYVGTYRLPLRILTVTPRDSTGFSVAAQRDAWRKLNSLIKQLPSQYPYVFVGDAAKAIQDTASADPNPQTNTVAESGSFTAGGTHPTTLGAYRVAALAGWPSLAAALRWAGFGQVIDGRRTIDLGGAEQLTNTDFTSQTTGTVPAGALTGTIPAGWRVVSAVAVASSFPWFIPEATRQRGNWVTLAVYAVGDGVTSTGAYRCLVAHTAGVFATDLAAGYWERVWASEYCWQVDFTATGADQVVDIRRSTPPSFLAQDVVCSGGFVATESSANIKQIVQQIKGNLTEAASYVLTCQDAGPTLFGGATQSVVGRIEGLFCTPKCALAPNSASAGWVTNLPNWQLQLTSVGAGVMTVILYKPFFRKF